MDLEASRAGRKKPRVLVAPLDWGLGHATRCIPLIRELMEQGAEVLLAGEGAQELLLREAFPGLACLPLPGYRVRYARSGPGLLWNLLYQTPKILRAIRQEQEWIQTQVEKEGITGIISDNRYGLWHEKIPSIFITHQLMIKTPWGTWADRMLQKRNYRYIEKFNECWVPDAPGPQNLAGELSHPKNKPGVPVKYIGALSRFTRSPGKEEKYHALFVISGPEPQRSLWENIVVNQLARTAIAATVVRGLPGSQQLIPSTKTLSFYNHLPLAALEAEFQKADIVIARSGYSTVMDLARLEKKSILIPTPGQTEQEYLAAHLAKSKMAHTVSQKAFSLVKALEEARKEKFRLQEPFTGDELKYAIGKFLEMPE
jgi:UDP:flavonoid glycosyltransferase YjiC (YdhE family)